jgi:hypothetical protein
MGTLNQERGSEFFSQAIKTLEEGDWDKAEQLFIAALNNLGNKHHLSVLALKSLVTISSNKGELEKSLDWSLQLLDAQSVTLGLNHADTSRTVSNIITMCVTLGKTSLADEVKELAQYAREAEKSTRTQQAAQLRKRNVGRPPPQEDEQDEETAGLITMTGKALPELWDKTQDAPSALAIVFVVLLLTTTFGTLAALKFTFNSDANQRVYAPQTTYMLADNSRELRYESPFKMEVAVPGEKLSIPFKAFGYDFREIGDLLLSSIIEKEHWLALTPDGFEDQTGALFFKSSSKELIVLRQVNSIVENAEVLYKRQRVYPDKLSEIGDFSYRNPYTLRRDYPVIQVVSILGNDDPNVILGRLTTGGRWGDEPASYPAGINCAHVSKKTNTSVPETFIIHAYNKYGQYFTRNDGSLYVITLQKGQLVQRSSSSHPFRGVGVIRILDLAPGLAPTLLPIFMYRLTLFYGLITFVLGVVGLIWRDEKARAFCFLLSLISLIVGVVAAVCCH